MVKDARASPRAIPLGIEISTSPLLLWQTAHAICPFAECPIVQWGKRRKRQPHGLHSHHEFHGVVGIKGRHHHAHGILKAVGIVSIVGSAASSATCLLDCAPSSRSSRSPGPVCSNVRGRAALVMVASFPQRFRACCCLRGWRRREDGAPRSLRRGSCRWWLWWLRWSCWSCWLWLWFWCCSLW